MIKKKTGKITPNGVILEKHEYKTVIFFTEMGYDVELIPKSNMAGVHTSDMFINGIKWEMKAPKGEGKYLMQNTIQNAVKQSENVIIDLRRVKRHQTKCLSELKREFEKSKSLKKLRIITKTSKMLEYSK